MRWQLGYRIKWATGLAFDPYATPYTDLPEFEATQEEAFKIQSQLQADFPYAEWRLVEVR